MHMQAAAYGLPIVDTKNGEPVDIVKVPTFSPYPVIQSWKILRKAPEHLIPAAYEDSWATLQWVASHSSNNGGGGGPESWLNHHADFERVFLVGDSDGANITHNMALLAGSGDSEFGLNVEILGIALVHPYFWGSDPIGSESLHLGSAKADRLWPLICPSNPDNNDPRVNPVVAGGPSLVGLECRRALVCVAENDLLKDRGWVYYNALSKCGWMDVVEIFETDGEDHVFHLHDLQCEKAKDLIRRLAAFFNRDMPRLPGSCTKRFDYCTIKLQELFSNQDSIENNNNLGLYFCNVERLDDYCINYIP
ncbi:hypothetical protein QYF36_002786 [Acer negundo]|nr:hypothetical protein QYF36_002786 [Acer negundo]